MTKPALLHTIVTFLLIATLGYTGIDKLLHYKAFLASLGFLPAYSSWVKPAARSVPLLEVLTSLLLCFRKSRSQGLMMASWLFAAFTLYVLWMLLFVPDLPCSCGGMIASLSWAQHLLLNISLLTISIAAAIYQRRLHRTIQAGQQPA